MLLCDLCFFDWEYENLVIYGGLPDYWGDHPFSTEEGTCCVPFITPKYRSVPSGTRNTAVFCKKTRVIIKAYQSGRTEVLLLHGLSQGTEPQPAKPILGSYQRIADAPDPVTVSCSGTWGRKKDNEIQRRQQQEPGDEREQVQGYYPACPVPCQFNEQPWSTTGLPLRDGRC